MIPGEKVAKMVLFRRKAAGDSPPEALVQRLIENHNRRGSDLDRGMILWCSKDTRLSAHCLLHAGQNMCLVMEKSEELSYWQDFPRSHLFIGPVLSPDFGRSACWGGGRSVATFEVNSNQVASPGGSLFLRVHFEPNRIHFEFTIETGLAISNERQFSRRAHHFSTSLPIKTCIL